MSYRVLPLLVVYVFCNLKSIVYVVVANATPHWFLPVNAFPLMDTLPFYIRGNRSYWELELWDSAFQRYRCVLIIFIVAYIYLILVNVLSRVYLYA